LNTSKAEQRQLLPLTNSLFLDSKAVWIRLTYENYPRTALWLPKIYRKQAICEVHGTIISGHDALKKDVSQVNQHLFLAEHEKRYSRPHRFLFTMPSLEEINCKTYSTTAFTNSGSA